MPRVSRANVTHARCAGLTGPTADHRARTRRRAQVRPAVVTGLVAGCLVSALVACSSSTSPVAAAQSDVKAKERALTEAEAAATGAAAAFCDATGVYVTALDRYGDVLHASAVTVGDVKDAGADLLTPSQEARDAGDAVVETREALLAAQGELVDAQDSLASAQAVAASQAPPSPGARPTSPPPVVAPTSVERVEQAEDDFTSALAGITDQTPLVQAAERFNAAAVALETAWLRLVAQSGCLNDDQQDQAVAAASSYTSTLQQSLTDTGYYAGQVDGVYGPATVAAVEALQKAHDLPQTGTVDKATAAALDADLTGLDGADAQEALVTTAALQQTLTLTGYWDGPVDGQWTDELAAALAEAQEALGVPVTGTVDAATIGAFQEALVELREPAPSPDDPAPSVEPSA